jgi:hypothetical protein
MKKRGTVKKVGKRLAQGGVVLLVAAGVMLIAYEILGPSDNEKVAGPPPVKVRVLLPGSFDSAHPYAPYYVVPDKRFASPAQLSKAATNSFVTRPEAALGKGGQAGSPQIVRLELRSTTDEPVTVDGVSFHVVSSARPLKGWFTAQPACSSVRVRVARLDLDARRRAVRYVDAKGASSRALSLALKRSAPALLELQAATRNRRIAWTAELSISRSGGRSQTVAVDNGGQPFRVTSPRRSRGYAPEFGATGITGFVRQRSWDGGRIKGCS